MAAVDAAFPSQDLTLQDVVASFAGLRPVIGSGKADRSKESRDHVLWQEHGLLTVTGGKLTTFRLIAPESLKIVGRQWPGRFRPNRWMPVLDPVNVALPGGEGLSEAMRRRLLGRYGVDTVALVAAAGPGELEPVPNTLNLWAELRWAARAEGVGRLDDLLLRRVRLGLLLPQGGAALLPRIRTICQPELGWDDAKWEAEEQAYLSLWRTCYSLPAGALVPDWLVRRAGGRPKPVEQRAASFELRTTVGPVRKVTVALVWGMSLLEKGVEP